MSEARMAQRMGKIDTREIPAGYQLHTFTPETIGDKGHDPVLVGAVKLLHAGIEELEPTHGREFVDDLLATYVLQAGDTPGSTTISLWEHMRLTQPDRKPFMHVITDQSDKPVAAVEGRVYDYAYGGNTEYPPRKSVFVNMITVDPQHRREGMGEMLYDQVERTAEEQGADLVLAGVNPLNKPSAALHEKRMIRERPPVAEGIDPDVAYFTTHGVYHPSYPVEGVTKEGIPVQGEIVIFSKTLGKA